MLYSTFKASHQLFTLCKIDYMLSFNKLYTNMIHVYS